ncbi:MAG: hypothetical protein M3O22_00900 [Pseudomonadota bacterium]|nr:hypothetical protein [Pseudomonadota bacterium]
MNLAAKTLFSATSHPIDSTDLKVYPFKLPEKILDSLLQDPKIIRVQKEIPDFQRMVQDRSGIKPEPVRKTDHPRLFEIVANIDRIRAERDARPAPAARPGSPET